MVHHFKRSAASDEHLERAWRERVDYSEQPGQGYDKILRDAVTGEWPIVSYRKPSFIHGDNRIVADACDISHYHFGPPSDGDVTIQAQLWFRRLFIGQAREKGWDTPDLLTAEASAWVPATAATPLIFLLVITRR